MRLPSGIALILVVTACGPVGAPLDRDVACRVSDDIVKGTLSIERALDATEAGNGSEAVAAAGAARRSVSGTIDLLRTLQGEGMTRPDLLSLNVFVVNIEQTSVFLDTAPEPNHPDLADLRRVVKSVRQVTDDLHGLLSRNGISCE